MGLAYTKLAHKLMTNELQCKYDEIITNIKIHTIYMYRRNKFIPL